MSNELKEKIQNKGVLLSSQYSFLILEHPTGLGKTLSGIKIIEENGGFWNIVIAETNHELTWKDEFKKHNKEHLLKQVRFFCYQSLHKYTSEENFIFDEVHRLLNSDLRLEMFKEIMQSNIKQFVGLSATLSKKLKYNLSLIVTNVHYYKINLSDAIEHEVLPEPKVYIVGIDLDNVTRNGKYSFTKDKFIMVTQKEWYDRQTTYIDKLKITYFESRNAYDKIKWLLAGNNRKKFLAATKTKSANMLLAKLKEKRLICFANNIPQAEYLSRKKNCIHSKIGKTERETILNNFNEGKIDKLFAVGMLREGVNLKGIEAGVIVQLDNVERMFTQILGRTLRSSFPELYIMYIKGTQDEQYLKTCLENFNMDYVTFKNLNEI